MKRKLKMQIRRAERVERLVYIVYFLLAAVLVNLLASGAKADTIERQIVRAAIEQGVDPSLALAIATVESGLNPNAIGSIGEIGLFQLRPEFHSVTTDVKTNIQAGVRYLADLKKTCSHYGEAYFVCFNYGTARRLKHPTLFPYYRKVVAEIARRKSLDRTVLLASD